MFRWLVVCVLLCATIYGVMYLLFEDFYRKGSPGDPTVLSSRDREAGPGGDLQPVAVVLEQGSKPKPARQQPVVVSGCRLLVTDRQEVPSERDGQLLIIGTEVKPGETVPPDRLLTATIGFLAFDATGESVPEDQQITFKGNPNIYRRWRETDPLIPGKVVVASEVKKYRRLEVGDEVQAGQSVALVDPTLALNELAIKNAQTEAASSEVRASIATKLEAERRVVAMEKARERVPGSVSEDDFQAAKLTARRYAEEEVAKKAAVIKSQQELIQALTVVRKHEVKATISGVVKVIYKNRGEAIKTLEPILQLQNPKVLRVEGMVEVQEAEGLRRGLEAIVEPTQPERPELVLRGHLQEVTCVTVSKPTRADSKTWIISGSEDRTVRGWDRGSGLEAWMVPYRAAVRALACTRGTASSANLLLIGGADGTAVLVDLDNLKEAPRSLAESHRGAILCAAFSPDGSLCATGGEDRSICLWEPATGKLVQRYPAAHKAAVTSLEFTANGQIVSAGRDNLLRIWEVQPGKPLVRRDEIDRRSGDVPQLGVSPDGKHVLFDQGKEIRLLALADRQIEGILQNPTGSMNFSTMAVFAPNGATILTNSAGDGRLQLWRTPVGHARSAELRQFIWTSGIVTCGAFAPDSTFAVTGTQDHQVLVWPLPPSEPPARGADGKELPTQSLPARITLVERALDSSSRQVRIWAELENPGWLIPGGTATMVIPAVQRTASRPKAVP